MKRFSLITGLWIISLSVLHAQDQYPKLLPEVVASKTTHYTGFKATNAAFDSSIYKIIQNTNLDSLVTSLRILTGEDSLWIDGDSVSLKNRSYENNDNSAEFLKYKLKNYGLETVVQPFNVTGKNICGIQTGCLYPDQYYIICAHYDAVTDYAADDNATGVATVLEAARILTKYDLKYSLI